MSRLLSIFFVAFAMVFHGGGIVAISSAQAKEEWSVQCSRQQCQVYAEIRLQNGVLFNNIAFRKLNATTYAASSSCLWASTFQAVSILALMTRRSFRPS